MADRLTILAKVRAALRNPRSSAQRAPGGKSLALKVFSGAPPADPRPWLPPVGDAPEAWVEQFARTAADLRAEFVRVPSVEAAIPGLRALADAEGWERVATHGQGPPAQVAEGLGRPILRVDGGYDVAELERCSAGITACDALIAQTGSVLITARSCGGRALSVYPPHHVVIATLDQVVPDLPAAFDRVRERYAGDYPSLISLITGPSRTGDIERVIVLGAHGPKRLTVVLIG